MTPDELEDFQWTYSIADLRDPALRPLTTFMRLSDAKTELERMRLNYPEMELSVFVRGDQLHTYPQDGIHEQTH